MSPPLPDPIQIITRGHTQVTAWIEGLWASLDALAGEPQLDPSAVEACFREQVREHVLFLEDRLLPALMDLDPEPAVATLVSELRRDHLAILAECSRLFADLAGCMAAEDASACVLCAHTRARSIRARVKATTAREHDLLIPLVRRHREALAMALAA